MAGSRLSQCHRCNIEEVCGFSKLDVHVCTGMGTALTGVGPWMRAFLNIFCNYCKTGWRPSCGCNPWICPVQFQAEVKLLAPSLLPVFGSAAMDPRQDIAAVTVEAADIFQPNSAPAPPSITPRQTADFPVVARGWSEECEPSFQSKRCNAFKRSC